MHPGRGLIVGAVYSEDTLHAAGRLAALPAAPDLLELRIDHFAAQPEQLEALAAAGSRPLIVTVRAAGEGGYGDLAPLTRLALYERFLPWARYVDLEIASLDELPEVAAQARGTAGGLIASCHDFSGMPTLGRLHALAGRAAEAGAAIFKSAVRVERPADLAVLCEFLGAETRLPLAVMGMGPLGQVSRLLTAALGSRLNYGFLGAAPQVPGQWPVGVLRERLDELLRPAEPPD